ncbi:hypothetical protein ACTG16_23935 [Aeromonas sp. 23P]|uniref:hypothetical protein n=1 Tax=Aeromonas sp. 23P TaxID=3452716 RepID=UPI003F7A9B17
MSDFHKTHSFRLYLDDDEEMAIDKYLSGFNKFRKAEVTRNIVKLGFAQLKKEKGEGRTTKARPVKPKAVKPTPPASSPSPAPVASEQNGVAGTALPDSHVQSPAPIQSLPSYAASSGVGRPVVEESPPDLPSTDSATSDQMPPFKAHPEVGGVDQSHGSAATPDLKGSFATSEIAVASSPEPVQHVAAIENGQSEVAAVIERNPQARTFIDPMERLRLARERKGQQ